MSKEKQIKTSDWLIRGIPKEQLERKKREAVEEATAELQKIHIEEMEKVVNEQIHEECSMTKVYEALYNAGYRKQKEGEWKHHKSTAGGIHDTYRCSICDHVTGWTTTFCPNCGANMKGGAE